MISSQFTTSTIALVEDNDSLRNLLAFRLRSLGYDVLTAACVDDAIVLIESTRVDSVLSDNGMPGATGLDLLAYVSHRRPQIAFTLMSGAVTPEMEAAAWSDGAVAVVEKDELLRRLDVFYPPGRARPAIAA
jgi:DNA-binding NtrC family response regulator